MKIRYIREFIAVAECGNYLTAAEASFISQSSLSKHILTLEQELGFPLLIRTTRKVRLSPYGKLFLPYAQNIVAADDACHRKLSEISTAGRDSLRLGILPSFLAYHMNRIIIDFKQAYPQHTISLTEAPSDILLNHLHDGNCCLALIRTYENKLSAEFASIPIVQDKLVLLVTPESPFGSDQTVVTWKELENIDILTGVMNSKKLVSLLAQREIHLNTIFLMSRASSTIDMVRRGVCPTALINKHIAESYLADGFLRVIEIEPPILSTVALVYRKDAPQTAAMRHFIETVRSYATKR